MIHLLHLRLKHLVHILAAVTNVDVVTCVVAGGSADDVVASVVIVVAAVAGVAVAGVGAVVCCLRLSEQLT